LPPTTADTPGAQHSGITLHPGAFFGRELAHCETRFFGFSDLLGTCPESRVERHTHAGSHFVYILRGRYVTEARGETPLCGPSTLIFNPTGTTHRDRFTTTDGRFITISLDRATAQLIESQIQVANRVDHPRVPHLIHQIAFEFRRPQIASELILEGLGLELLGIATRFNSAHASVAPSWLRSVRDQLRDTHSFPFTISELAASVGVHPVYLARAFRKHFHCSPGQYQRACRMEEVLRQLTTSSIPLAELAQRNGFSDQSQLTRACKRFTGLTPGALRRLRFRNDKFMSL